MFFYEALIHSPFYEELKEKYKTVHDDLKAKKKKWKELARSWREHEEDEEGDPEECA